jgi:hypothetical protein
VVGDRGLKTFFLYTKVHVIILWHFFSGKKNKTLNNSRSVNIVSLLIGVVRYANDRVRKIRVVGDRKLTNLSLYTSTFFIIFLLKGKQLCQHHIMAHRCCKKCQCDGAEKF